MNEAALGHALTSLTANILVAEVGTYAALRRHVTPSHGIRVEVERLLRAAGVVPQNADQHQRWTLLLHSLVMARSPHSSDPAAATGAVLARLQISETRLKQLVEAQSTELGQVMPAMARRLAPTGWAVDWAPLANLILYADTEQDDLAQAARRAIVSQYLQQRRRRTSNLATGLQALEAVTGPGELQV